jgi:hypothetical protein
MKMLTVILLVIFSSALTAFAETSTFVCNYPKYSDDEGLHSVKDKFVLTFIVDSDKGNAYMVGNQGSTEVKMLLSELGFTFIEITGVGNVMTTTIDSTNGAVHSRNTVIAGKLIPTQYYGKCVFK